MASYLVQLNMGEVAEWLTSGILPSALLAAARRTAAPEGRDTATCRVKSVDRDQRVLMVKIGML